MFGNLVCTLLGTVIITVAISVGLRVAIQSGLYLGLVALGLVIFLGLLVSDPIIRRF